MIRKLFQGAGLRGHHFRDSSVVALVLSCGLACAADAVHAARYHIDQPTQPLAESLRAIARQTGISVIFDPDKVGGRSAHAVSGQLTAEEAVAQALEGSDLVLTVMPDGPIVIRAERSAPASAPQPSAPPVRPERAGESGAAPVAVLVQASSPTVTDSVRGNAAEAAEGPTSLTRVEVTGSRLKRIDADGPTPVNVYSRADIERSGQPTLDRFLSGLNEVSMSSGEGGSSQANGQGTVQLRGLPLGSTLVLINGRRLQATGSSPGNFFDLSVIPMAAVERVEIVPVGSSAVYGGDALAGVVNIILKKQIDGVVLDARAGSARGIGDGSVALGTGGADEKGSFVVLASYRNASPLTMSERRYFSDGDYRRFGGVDSRTRFCTPGTVSSATAANLPGLNSTFAAIPSTGPGQPLTVASIAVTSGQANLCNSMANGNGSALIHGLETFGLHAAGERHLSEDWTAFGELTLTRERLHADQSGLLLNNVLVPATNPYNPFGVAVRVNARLGLENGAESLHRETDFKRALFGVRGDVAQGWELEATASSTRDDGLNTQSNTTANVAARTAALASSTPATALNPFTTGRAASDDVLRAIWPDSNRDGHGRKDQASVFVRGSALTLPTGSVDVIVGAETAHDSYLSAIRGGNSVGGSRSSSAAYGEARVPLWRAADAGPARDLAALTLAARRDVYSDFGGADTYQAGLEFRPTRTSLLRASTATSFKPPTLLQTNVNDVSLTTDAYAIRDPQRGNALVSGGEVLRTTNPNLNPEKGRAMSLGAVWEPESAAGTRLGLTAWQVRINGLISLLWPQTAVDNESLFPGFVTRAPSVGGVPGAITRVLYSEVNFGKVDTAGVDMEIAHAWKAAGAKWTASASATRTSKYDVALAPGAPVTQRLNVRAVDYWAPRWKGRLQAAVEQGTWALSLTSRYLGAYRDMPPDGRALGNYWVHDLSASVDLKRLGLGIPAVKDARLSLAIANLADRQPEYVSTSPYYDVTQADWRGRYTTLRMSLGW
jgi:iron complex outermembrane receptor protein